MTVAATQVDHGGARRQGDGCDSLAERTNLVLPKEHVVGRGLDRVWICGPRAVTPVLLDPFRLVGIGRPHAYPIALQPLVWVGLLKGHPGAGRGRMLGHRANPAILDALPWRD